MRENYERQKTGEEESIYLYICLGHLESAVSAFPYKEKIEILAVEH